MPIDNRPLSNPVPEEDEDSTTATSGQTVHAEGKSPFELAREAREAEEQNDEDNA